MTACGVFVSFPGSGSSVSGSFWGVLWLSPWVGFVFVLLLRFWACSLPFLKRGNYLLQETTVSLLVLVTELRLQQRAFVTKQIF